MQNMKTITVKRENNNRETWNPLKCENIHNCEKQLPKCKNAHKCETFGENMKTGVFGEVVHAPAAAAW